MDLSSFLCSSVSLGKRSIVLLLDTHVSQVKKRLTVKEILELAKDKRCKRYSIQDGKKNMLQNSLRPQEPAAPNGRHWPKDAFGCLPGLQIGSDVRSVREIAVRSLIFRRETSHIFQEHVSLTKIRQGGA